MIKRLKGLFTRKEVDGLSEWELEVINHRELILLDQLKELGWTLSRCYLDVDQHLHYIYVNLDRDLQIEFSEVDYTKGRHSWWNHGCPGITKEEEEYFLWMVEKPRYDAYKKWLERKENEKED